ncbi:uncharacterized protein EDB91DRAFT_1291140 [Suillus paluster]|uniref:uncharacterized protein n=1 Tax=Suillus paluster TaxID=48578 RepID=UPI001B869D97|nr:uncharacterized protein EDB91DRAFT_1291140 [Suillus paluster]KAG1737129.1 hypothetical protein EDB91DRAFT_1291140 [Suillus paluster]
MTYRILEWDRRAYQNHSFLNIPSGYRVVRFLSLSPTIYPVRRIKHPDLKILHTLSGPMHVRDSAYTRLVVVRVCSVIAEIRAITNHGHFFFSTPRQIISGILVYHPTPGNIGQYSSTCAFTNRVHAQTDDGSTFPVLWNSWVTSCLGFDTLLQALIHTALGLCFMGPDNARMQTDARFWRCSCGGSTLLQGDSNQCLGYNESSCSIYISASSKFMGTQTGILTRKAGHRFEVV